MEYLLTKILSKGSSWNLYADHMMLKCKWSQSDQQVGGSTPSGGFYSYKKTMKIPDISHYKLTQWYFGIVGTALLAKSIYDGVYEDSPVPIIGIYVSVAAMCYIGLASCRLVNRIEAQESRLSTLVAATRNTGVDLTDKLDA